MLAQLDENLEFQQLQKSHCCCKFMGQSNSNSRRKKKDKGILTVAPFTRPLLHYQTQTNHLNNQRLNWFQYQTDQPPQTTNVQPFSRIFSRPKISSGGDEPIVCESAPPPPSPPPGDEVSTPPIEILYKNHPALKNNNDIILTFPEDILLFIFSLSDPPTLFSLLAVNKKWNRIAHDRTLAHLKTSRKIQGTELVWLILHLQHTQHALVLIWLELQFNRQSTLTRCFSTSIQTALVLLLS